MTDDAFHLTPLDVRRFEFPGALRGYDRERVDAFREQVAEEMERLSRQLQELESRAKGFHEQLRAFRERDKALNDALVSAQQLRGEMKEQAEREAALIVREARAEGQRVIEMSRTESQNIIGEMEALTRSRRTYLAQLKALTERQLAEIEAAWSLSAAAAQPVAQNPDSTSGEPPAVAAAESTADGEPPEARATPVWLKSLVEED